MRPVRSAQSRRALRLLAAIAACGLAESARAITPEDFAQTRAAAAYRAGDFAAALADTDRLLAREPRDPILLRVRGMSLYRLNRHAEAAEALKRAVAVAPQDPLAQFWLGAALLAQKDFAGSIAAFETVKRLAPNTRYSENAEKFLAAARAGDAPPAAARPAKPWSASFSTGGQYDSNVALTPFDKIGSFRIFESLSGAYTFALPGSLALTLDGRGYGSQHFHSLANDYDLALAGGGATLAWRTTLAGVRMRLSGGYAYERIWQQGVRFSDTHTITARLDAAVLSNSVSSLKFTAEYGLLAFRTGGSPAIFSRDAARYNGEVRHLQHFAFGGARHHAWAGYAYESIDADGANFDSHGHIPAAGITFTLPFAMSLDLGGEWAFVDHVNYVDSPRRRTFKQAYLARLNKLITPEVALSGAYAYTYEHSNIPVFSYRRHVATLSATITF